MADRRLEPLRCKLAPVGEQEALAGAKPAHRIRCQHLTPHAFVSIGVEGLSKDANVIAGVTLSSFPLILRVSKDCMPGLDVRSMTEGAAAGANVSSEAAFHLTIHRGALVA